MKKILLFAAILLIVDGIGIVFAEEKFMIVSPVDGTVYEKGENIEYFIVPLIDISTLTEPVTYKLTSSLDGDITTEAEVGKSGWGVINTDSLSIGRHNLIIEVSDAVGVAGLASVMVNIVESVGTPTTTVRPPVTTVPPPSPEVEGLADKIKNIAEKTDWGYVITKEKTGLKKTSLEIETDEDIGDVTIEIKEYTGYADEVPPKTVKMSIGTDEVALGTFVSIEAPDVDFDWVTIKISYTDEELEDSGISEDSLVIRWFDPDEKTWIVLSAGSPEWVHSAGVDKENNFVWVKVSHFSVYGITATIGAPRIRETPPPITEPPTTTVPPKPTPQPEEGEKKGICGPTALILLSVLPLFLRRKKS